MPHLRRPLALLCLAAACAPATRTTVTPTASTATAELRERDPALARDLLARMERQRAEASRITPYLQHGDGRVRARAALALARVADPSATEALIAALTDRGPQVRALAAFALGRLDPELPLLADQLAAGHRGRESWVREAATSRAHAERSLDARLHVEGNPLVRRALYAALGRLAIGPGLHHLRAGLSEPGLEPAFAATALGIHAIRRRASAHRSPEITARLIELSNSKLGEIRVAATFALARHRACDASDAMLQRLREDADAAARSWAARGLETCKTPIEPLLAALGDPDWRVQVEVLRSLQHRADEGQKVSRTAVFTFASALAKQLNDTNEAPAGSSHVLRASLGLLSRSQLDQLKILLAPRPGRVQTAHSGGLASLRCQVEIGRAGYSLNLSPLVHCGGLQPEEVAIKLRELRALVQAVRRKPKLTARLLPYLDHADPRVRVAAVQALEKARDAASRGALLRRLAQDADAAVIEAVADTVTAWPEDAALVEILQQALDRSSSGDSPVIAARVALARALATHGKKVATERLARMAQDEALPVRNAVRRALGQRPTRGQARAFGKPPQLDVQGLHAHIHTQRGSIHVKLLGDEAPETVANFVKLARRGFYDGLTFHRVVADFVVQGGDPRGDGYGGPGYVIPDEVTPRPYIRGTLGMALDGRDTGGSQFFFTQSRQPHLDGGYTAFGQVLQGFDVVDRLLPGDAILGIDIEQVEPSELGASVR